MQAGFAANEVEKLHSTAVNRFLRPSQKVIDMSEGITKTDDKAVALMILERCLGSKEYLNVGIQNLDGEYAIEVSKPTDDPGEETND